MSAPKKLSDLSDAERYEAYSRLFRFDKEEDIDAKEFADKTGMAVLSVNSMIRHAKGNAKLYEEMVALGYSDESFPVWWYSPGREGTEGTTLQEGEQIAGRGIELKEGEDFAPTPPDTPVPKEARPALPESSPSSPSQPVPSPSSQGVPSPSSFSDAELSLLEAQGITEVTLGRWMHTMEQANGSILLTPVDPRREMLNIKREAQGDEIMGAVGEHMIKQLSVHTQAIMKKVAFNPNAFQCWQFVSNAVDPDTGDPFVSPKWDFGDFVSHCISWTTEHEYGIVPTVLYNRPSRYTQLREMRQRRAGVYDEAQLEHTPISNIDLPRDDYKERDQQ